MVIKLLEIRDEGTTIAAIAVQVQARTAQERWLLARAGYGDDPSQHGEYVLLASLYGDEPMRYDPNRWGGGRTMRVAHEWLRTHFDEVETGAVVDVQYILGETVRPKESDRFYYETGEE